MISVSLLIKYLLNINQQIEMETSTKMYTPFLIGMN